MTDSVHGFSFTAQHFGIWLGDRTLLLLSVGTVAGAVRIIVQQARGLGVLRAREIVNQRAGRGDSALHTSASELRRARPRQEEQIPMECGAVTADLYVDSCVDGERVDCSEAEVG